MNRLTLILFFTLTQYGMITNAKAFWGFPSEKEEIMHHQVAEIQIQGSFPDQATLRLFSPTQSFQSLLQRIKMAEKDPHVKAVLFRFGGLQVGLAKANEIRQAILSLRKSGKQTYGMLDVATTPGYIASTGCQKIIMVPGGMLYIPGLRTEMLYFKKMLDSLGLVADFVTIGEFKTAPEPFLRETMSNEQRNQVNSYLNDLYEQMITTISKSRGLSPDSIRKAIDQALFSAYDALQKKLIDHVAYAKELQGWIRTQVKQRPLHFIPNYAKKKNKKPSSLWAMLSVLWQKEKINLEDTTQKIALVYAQGPIAYGERPPSSFGDHGIWSSEMLNILDEVNKLKNLKAIVLRINSPGGSALASDLIWKKLEHLKKKAPLFVSMGRVAASGGYYIAMGADILFAQPATITGSIGVFGGKMVLRETLNKIGIQVQSVSRGKHSAIFSPFSVFSESERSTLKTMLSNVYKDFVKKAAQGRKMTYNDIIKLAGGRVWTGKQAKANHLVDQVGGLQDTLRIAREKTGADKNSKIIVFPRPIGFYEMLTKMSSLPNNTLPLAHSDLQKFFKMFHPSLRQTLFPIFRGKQDLFMWAPIPKIDL